MKKTFLKQAIFLPVFITVVSLLQAQRNDRVKHEERKEKRNDANRTQPAYNRNSNTTHRVYAPRPSNPRPTVRSTRSITTLRNPVVRPSRVNVNVYANGNRGGRYITPRINNYNFRRTYIAPRFTVGVPYYGQTFSRINHPFISIGFGGFNYNYYGGVFYKPYNNYYRVVAPPRGIRIAVLPIGYHSFYSAGNPYYYYNGIFYNHNNSNYYEVVAPPLGAKLPSLPAGAKEVSINGQPYFENEGTYYAEEYNEKNEVLYTVVGVDGVLNNDQVLQLPKYEYENENNGYDETLFSTLPSDCKQVEINGQKLYLSPQNNYYQEVMGSDGTIRYQIVGKM